MTEKSSLKFYNSLKRGWKFVIPWKNKGLPSKWSAFKWRMMREKFIFPSREEIEKNQYLNPHFITRENVKNMISDKVNMLKYTWIQHACMFVSFKNFNIITDPFFSGRAGPWIVRLMANFENCKSHSILPVKVDTLPKVDAVFISHDHFDHLDVDSIKSLYQKYGDKLIWFTPLGFKKWFSKFSISNVIELDWWEEVNYNTKTGLLIKSKNPSFRNRNDITDFKEEYPQHEKSNNPYYHNNLITTTDGCTTNNSSMSSKFPQTLPPVDSRMDEAEIIKIAFCPSQHWCSRMVFDIDWRLWGSWVVKNKYFSYFFAGDTGYCDIFKAIGYRYGPFDLAAIPIGAYEPRYLMENEHIDPTEAVKIHNDLKSKNSVGIHWGSFHFSDEGFFDPPGALSEAIRKNPLNGSKFNPVRIGMTYDLVC